MKDNIEDLIPILKKEIKNSNILNLVDIKQNFPVYQSTSDIHGLGIFTPMDMDGGKFIGVTHTFYSGMWYQVFPLGVFYNHSKNPNCEVEIDGNILILKSINSIKRNTELTVDYTKQPYLEQPKKDWA